CEMYTQPQKKFRARKDEDILQDIQRIQQAYPGIRRVFLADGDAMVLPVRRLKELLKLLREHFPVLERVSSYCLPRNLKNKSVEELQELRELGLDRSEEHTSELQSRENLVCRLLLEKK